jgi:phosphopantetheine--protein transferase-like protein
MIIGVGIDLVETVRCADWFALSDVALGKWLQADEIAYCKSVEAQFAQRCAARLAVKEAFYKAFAPLNTAQKTLFSIAHAITVVHEPSGAPRLVCDWDLLLISEQRTLYPNIIIHLSISHIKDVATAVVILEA